MSNASISTPDTYGLVMITSGPFKGWVGQYDDNDEETGCYIVYPLYPVDCCPYKLYRSTSIRTLTGDELEYAERRERSLHALGGGIPAPTHESQLHADASLRG